MVQGILKKRRRDLNGTCCVGLAEANSSASPAPTTGVEELGGGRSSKRRKGTLCLEDVLEENSRLKEQVEVASNERKAILAKLETFQLQVEDTIRDQAETRYNAETRCNDLQAQIDELSRPQEHSATLAGSNVFRLENHLVPPSKPVHLLNP